MGLRHAQTSARAIIRPAGTSFTMEVLDQMLRFLPKNKKVGKKMNWGVCMSVWGAAWQFKALRMIGL